MITLHGLPTFEKKIRATKRGGRRNPPKARTYIGAWFLEEDSEGNLLIRNINGQEIVLAELKE